MVPTSFEVAEGHNDDPLQIFCGVMNALAISLGSYAVLAAGWLLLA